MTSEALTRVASDVYVTGVWRCVKCEFRLVQATLNARDGTVTARDEPGEPCPNCASPLWRVSWRDEAKEAYVLAEQQMDRALNAERKLAEGHRAAILAFLSGEDVVEACARAMRQTEVNEDEDGWSDLNGWDRAEFRRQAHNAVAALRALVQEEK